MHFLVVRLNDLAIDLCCMRQLLHAFIGGSVNRTANSARLPNRQDWRIGQNIYIIY